MSSENRYITPKEAAKELGISTRTLANYRREGKIHSIRYSDRKILYPVSAIENFRINSGG